MTVVRENPRTRPHSTACGKSGHCPRCAELEAEVARLERELMSEKRGRMDDMQRRAQRGM